MVSPPLATDPTTPLTSEVLVRPTVAQLTTMLVVGTRVVAVSPEPSLEVVKVARLDTVPQVVASVGLVMWTLKVLPGPGEAARSMGSQVRVPVVIEQPVAGEAIVQVRPELVGRTSVMVKPWATPAPVLVPVIT